MSRRWVNILLMLAGFLSFVEIVQVKYFDNLIEQDQRFIKKITKLMMWASKPFIQQSPPLKESKRLI